MSGQLATTPITPTTTAPSPGDACVPDAAIDEEAILNQLNNGELPIEAPQIENGTSCEDGPLTVNLLCIPATLMKPSYWVKQQPTICTLCIYFQYR